MRDTQVGTTEETSEEPWREATAEEVKEYYREEFPQRIDDLPEFMKPPNPKQYALAFQEPHPIKRDDTPVRDFIRRHTWKTNPQGDQQYARFEDDDDLLKFVQSPARSDPLREAPAGLVDPDIPGHSEPVPTAVYYAADNWDIHWLLWVDIDGKDVARERARTIVDEDDYKGEDELLQKSGVRTAAPAGYPYSFEDIEQALRYGFEVERFFQNELSGEETRVVYSGQGAHVYLLDDDLQHHYDTKSREVINDLLVDEGIPIDTVVTADRRRVVRMLYSLHADVSRVVQPVDSPEFDFRTDAVPEFLK